MGPAYAGSSLPLGGLIMLETSCRDSKPSPEGLMRRYSRLPIIPCFLFLQALIKLDSA